MVRALIALGFSLATACGGSPARTEPTTPAPAQQACACACSCDGAQQTCDCKCTCGDTEATTETAVAVTPVPSGPTDPGGAPGDDTVEIPDWSSRVTKVDDTHYRISRATVEEILANPTAMARGARIVPAIKDGQPDGFKLYAIRPNSLYGAVGLKNGDTLRVINGMPLTTPDKALEVYQQVRNANRLELQLRRRGQDVVLVIEIE